MKAIITKYIPAQDGYKPRIQAWGFMTTSIIDCRNDFDLEANHLCAAVELLDKVGMGELSPYLITGMTDLRDYVHVVNYVQYLKDKPKLPLTEPNLETVCVDILRDRIIK